MDNELLDSELSENEQTILGLFFSVELNPKDSETNEYIIGEKRVKLDVEGIFSISKQRIGEEVDLLSSILKLLQDKEMVQADNGIYSLTDTGKIIGKRIRAKWFSESYDNLLLPCTRSQAYAKFCELVYGKNLLQFNVVDMPHLDLMQEKLQLNANDVVLDLGCGLGKITEYLVERTGASITGIDFSQKSIQWAKKNTKENEKLRYQVMDISELNFPANSFDAIIALDVLYWIDDLEPVIKKLKSILKSNGRMGVFYVQFYNPEKPTEPLLPETTNLAIFLKRYDFTYEVIDISQHAIDIWKQKLTIGKELRPQFLSEGNQDIIDTRMTDGVDVIKKFETNQQKRYFFSVKHK
ncbi:MAG: class I SAM-dependent methyltransferase [Candidatus Heimdallarchaeota archaeon]|nr:class I SAM-dependent methyltransferase [Candidatus Heimdallarchaeota archaeon]MBY8993783.1 class I SAM-dependent methyltransferase [Candidatus Heimdallarchaeota archaeon]